MVNFFNNYKSVKKNQTSKQIGSIFNPTLPIPKNIGL